MSYMRITEKEQADILKDLANVLISQPQERADGTVQEVFRRIPLSVFFSELYDARRDNPDADGEEVVYATLGELLRKVSAQAEAATTVDDVANMLSGLGHSMFNTSKRIARYLAGDQSMDGFVRADGDSLSFVSAVTNGTTQQATNAVGQKLYWKRNPVGGELGKDGLPYINGVLIPTTTEVTSWPVTVYKYTETVQKCIKFIETDDGLIPVDMIGAADSSGNGQAWLYKRTDGVALDYKTEDGQYVSAQLGNDGYIDLIGLRKPMQLDFSDWDNGYFTENLDGIIDPVTFSVTFDENGRPTMIVDETGHETNILW